jgi:hypothetical protein
MTGSRGRWRAVLAVSSLLVLGAAAGVTADRLVQKHRSAGMLRFEQVHSDPMRAIDRALDLRPDQRARVEAILKARQASLDAVWADTHTRLQATVDSVMDELTAVLDADQAERFRKLAEELHTSGRVRVRH